MASRPRVVVLGGGMAGLTTAWELSRGDWRSRVEGITVYQRGWRLGGKGASSRGPHGRIEEHGLHVLLGYYDATFRVLREAYAELDRERTDPSCPIRTWDRAFTPTGAVGLSEPDLGTGVSGWRHTVTRFGTNDRVPGEPGAEDAEPSPIEVARRAVGLLLDFHRDEAPPTAGVLLSTRPDPPTPRGRADVVLAARTAGLTALAVALEVADRSVGAARLLGEKRLVEVAEATIGSVRDALRRTVLADGDARRTWHLVDLVATNLVGMLADGVLGSRGYQAIDHLDYREWLSGHGAAAETVDSPIVRGMYDLVFGYEAGDRTRPRFSAGVGLALAMRMLFDFKGGMFWRMEAGMGEVVFAPLYQALCARGVEFRFFHRLDQVRLAPGGGAVGEIVLGRQADVITGASAYDPLVRVDGLPCWPAGPDPDQLSGPVGDDLESHHGVRADTGTVVLRAGDDFDVAVLAVAAGMVPHVCAEIVATDPRWADMTARLGTVATQSFQLWLGVDERELGWTGGTGVTLSGFAPPFDTWASMGHLLARERWDGDPPSPRTIAYFCGAMDEREVAGDDAIDRERVRRAAVDFLDTKVGALWPAAVDGDGFRWDLLSGDGERRGPARFSSQYWRANTDPSDRYVQSLPGSDRARLRPDASGYPNLVLAGDWTDSGLNAGCVEAATRSGVLAARAILGGGVSA